MWNGFWKLTVMVGVVGIGLFAVFQAQKGMSRNASISPFEATSEVDLEHSNEHIRPGDSTNEEPLVVLVDRSDRREPTRQKRRPLADDRIDLVGNFESDRTPVKPAMGSTKSSPHKLALASREGHLNGLSFRDDEESFEETTKTGTSEPAPLPDEGFDDEPNEPISGGTVPKNNVTLTGSSQAAPESTEDPFGDAGTPPANDIDSMTNEAVSIKRESVKIDFGDDSEIPRSRRGLEKSGKKTETPADEDADLFHREPKAMDAPLAIAPDGELPKELPALDAPAERVDEPDPLEDFSNGNPSSPAKFHGIPSDFLNETADEIVPNRSLPSRNRLSLPVSPDRELPGIEPGRSREPLNLTPDPERVTPFDMVGDGVAGNASQRGLQQPRLTIEKVAQQQAVLDQPLVYTIIVRNNGNVAAHNVVIEDRIPKGTELLGTSPRAELAGKTLIWKEPVLRPNEEKRISIKVVPKQEGPIGSVARVHFATEVSAEIQVAAPQLEFTVNAPSEVRIGQNFDLVFQLKNTGKVEASNITVRDLVPDHLKHETGNDIECPIGKLAPNEVREIVLPVIATKTGSGVNRAVLTADSGIQKQLETTIEVVGEQLVLTRSGHNRVYVERPAVFTNNIRNTGNRQVSRVRVSEVVPAGMEFETASDGGKYDPNLNAVVWTLGPLAPGDDRAITVKYVPKETGTLAGKITATGATGSTAAIQSTVEVVGRPELQMETLSATGVVTIGDKVTSKFQLKNSGTAPARNVQLRITLPPELRLLNVRGAKFQKEKNVVIFDSIDELSPRKTASFELVLEPTDEADARVVVEISADHLTKPHRREESIQIERDKLK